MAAVLSQLRRAKAGNLPSVNGDFAAGGLVHASQQVQDRRLARAGRAEHHAELALLNVKADIVHRLDHGIARLVMLADIFKSDVAHRGSSFNKNKP